MFYPSSTRLSPAPIYGSRRALAFCSLLCFLLISVSANTYAKTLPHVVFTNLLNPDKVTMTDILSFEQDAQGFMWIGSINGLARFDGQDYTYYTTSNVADDGLSNQEIWDLTLSRDERLWIATAKGITVFDPSTQTFSRVSALTRLNDTKIWKIIESQDGHMWIATEGKGVFRYNPKTHDVSRFKHAAKDPDSIADDNVLSLYEDQSQIIWVGTNSGLNTISPSSGETKRFEHTVTDDYSQKLNSIRAIVQWKDRRMLLATKSGLAQLTTDSQSIEPLVIGGDHSPQHIDVWDVKVDQDDLVWLATDGAGIVVMDIEQEILNTYKKSKTQPGSPVGHAFRTLFFDNIGDLWVGAFPTGVNHFDRSSDNIQIFYSAKDTLSHPSVLDIDEDEKGRLWIATDGGGVNLYDPSSRQFSYLVSGTEFDDKVSNPAAILSRDLSKNGVLSVLYNKGEVWAGTWDGGLNRYTVNNGANRVYVPDPTNPGSISNARVWTSYIDSYNAVWFCTFEGGLNRYDPTTDTFTAYTHESNNANSLKNDTVWSLLEDSDKKFWVGTSNGLDLLDRNTGSFTHYPLETEKAGGLRDATVLSLFEDSQQRLWVGTKGGLHLLNKNDDTFSVFTKKDGLPHNTIASIVEDRLGNLWIGTLDGIARINPDNNITAFNRKGWLQGNINFNSALLMNNGNLAFGGVNGMTIFNPETIRENKEGPSVVLTSLELFNVPVKINDSTGVITKPIEHTPSITLTYQQSVFSLTFAALSYRTSDKNTFSYKLKGFDKDWNNIGHRRRATYTNLDAGEYTFVVKAANNEGFWNHTGAQLKIIVLPPPWKTWWAYTLYAIFIALIIVWFVASQRKKVREAQERVKLEQEVNQRLRNLDKLKDDFLANTSHELRTPLNGIIGLSDSLIDGAAGELPEPANENLRMISASGKRLSGLVNDILDFSKLKNKRIDMHKRPIDLHSIVHIVLTLCKPLVGQKQIAIKNDVPKNIRAVMADEDRIQQILYNLIGNAIKFTPHGHVTIDAKEINDDIWVNIHDTGIGIDNTHIEKIFESFEQVESHENREFGGTGLGLAVTKQLIELHGSEITVKSTLGKGSTFSFKLQTSDKPAEPSSFDANYAKEKATHLMEDNDVEPENNETEEISEDETNHNTFLEKHSHKIHHGLVETNGRPNNEFRILIVDDEKINRQVLLNQLNMLGYQTVEASSGQEALDIISCSSAFDLILLDVMMPKMSGYEVCKQLRLIYPMHELPVIFLTAKNLISDLVDGFEVGANDFLTKPISKGELTSRVRTHLQLLDINKNLEHKVLTRTQQVENANQELETLDGIVATINKEVRQDRLLEILLKEATALFTDVNTAAYWQYDDKSEVFTCIASQGFEHSLETPINITAEHLNENFQMHATKITEDIVLLKPKVGVSGFYTSDKRVLPLCQIAMAMVYDHQLFGYIVLENSEDENAFKSTKPNTLARFRIHALSALSKTKLMDTLKKQFEQMREVSLTDQLTGLRNRHYFYKHIEADISLSIRKYKTITDHEKKYPDVPAPKEADHVFYLIDLDFFKSVNDTYGHTAGDAVLVQVKEILSNVFRDSDHLIRWGGEEFLVVARFCDRNSASSMAERIRRSFEDHEFDIGEEFTLKNTVSIGFASFPFIINQPGDISWEQTVEIADHSLYGAKKCGRNAWVGIIGPLEYESQDLYDRVINDTKNIHEQGTVTFLSSVGDDSPPPWK